MKRPAAGAGPERGTARRSAEKARGPYLALGASFDEHPKYTRCTLSHLGAIVCALTWSTRNLADGFVPSKALRAFGEGVDAATVEDLVRWKIWTRDRRADGIWIVGYLDRNPSRAEVLTKRAKNAKRLADWRSERAKAEETQATETASVTRYTRVPRAAVRTEPDPDPHPSPSTEERERAAAGFAKGMPEDLRELATKLRPDLSVDELRKSWGVFVVTKGAGLQAANVAGYWASWIRNERGGLSVVKAPNARRNDDSAPSKLLELSRASGDVAREAASEVLAALSAGPRQPMERSTG